ncbi:Polyketide cyclase / dehydrase and lipid transport [Streptomyces sp. WMMB 714]|uniref:SRPBCC family protein n=1 Tax=Streptomyces sp. WMMB 714 TaxID=1286822 RepID=UPI0005F77B38|nr:SRPBCC family protein [Streptomyces sp. WMMB 714]SCK46046.1 Polyketide cyclase / dehydrase and lipid transport [Streptomyces sp. WMMB 714]
MSRRKVVLTGLGSLFTLLLALVLIGSLRDIHVVTVTRATTADRDVLWELWADVPARTDWDEGLEHIRLDGPFEAGTSGEVKVEGQDPIDYEIVEVTPKKSYTDRFDSLLGTHTDWHHGIEPNDEGGYDATWRLEARGPMGLISLPALKSIFGEEVPVAVDKYVELAEQRSGVNP